MLNCPGCRKKTVVVDSRDYGTYLRRRRLCLSCKIRFTTYERVISKDPEIQSYQEKYPRDRRSNEIIKKCLRSLENVPVIDLKHWIVSRGGIE